MNEHNQPNIAPVQIGRHNVGAGESVYIVAEAGVNHDGDFNKAVALIDAAAQAGADAVRFQVFTASTLVTATAPTAAYQCERTAEQSQRDMLERLQLSDDAFRRLADHCAQRSIAFLATPFTPPDVRKVVGFDAPAIKIASTDIVDMELLATVCETGLPLILSTGAAEESEIAAAVALIESRNASGRLILLHCVSAYPTPLAEANLGAIGRLGRRFGVSVGYSDHTMSERTGALAVAAGAAVLEKHMTLDRDLPGPDHAMSLEPDALAEYVNHAREACAAMGTGEIGVLPIEREVRNVARKTIVAARDIATGELIARDMLVCKRSGSGLAPKEIGRLVGKRMHDAVPADMPVTMDMVG